MEEEAGVHNFNLGEFFTCLLQVHQRTACNYLRNYSGYHHDIRDIVLTYSNVISKLLVSPSEILKVSMYSYECSLAQLELVRKFLFEPPEEKQVSIIEAAPGDRRFSASEWTAHPFFSFLRQNYLLAERLSRQIAKEIDIGGKTQKKFSFYTSQYMNAFCPANFFFTNPEALKLAIETQGKSIRDGFNNLIKDLEKGRITQTDETAFKVGENLAVTPGAVIYEDKLMQLIQYTPASKTVSEIPLLIIPPWINKYYVLDLQTGNSFVKYLVEHGITVFMISWKNPKAGMGYLKLDDYIELGALKAIDVVRDICGVEKINTLGYCLGGTLLGIACAILAKRKTENSVASATFLAAMIDFSDIGPMRDVIDGALIRKLERGELLKDGILNGHDMETAFNLIRVNDLVWYYVINNYLKGKQPSAFDVIYWTNDNTNLPADMYVYYMKYMILENKLSRKNALRICDTPVDIGKIDVPVYVIALKDDIISPAITSFATTQLVNGPVEFILGESGHVMGVVNPPSRKKYGCYLDGKLGDGFEEWKKTARYSEGSWWEPWLERLMTLSGNKIPSPLKAGSGLYPVIEPAPGKFVKEKC